MASKRKKKVAIFSAIGLALVVIVAFVAMEAKGSTPKEVKLPAKVGKAEVADIQVKVTEVGNVQPEVKVDVKSAVSGKVISILHRDSETEYLAAKQEYERTQEKYSIVEKSGIPIIQSPEKFQGSNVVAPMDGIVLTKNVEIGESITSGGSSFNHGSVLFTVA